VPAVSQTPAPLTNPLDALLLPRVLRWVTVVFRQKSRCGHLDQEGRPWTRLPAKDLVAQLEREEGLEVTVRRVQRSLERLAEAGYLTRTQRTKWWGQRDWWYSWADAEWALQQCRPTSVSHRVTSQTAPNRRSEASVATGQTLGPQTLKTQTSKERPEGKAEVASPLDGARTCAGRQRTARPNPPQTAPNRSQRALAALTEVLAKVTQQPAPVALATEDSWVEGDHVFTRLPSGHVVVDTVGAGPLR
jgi:hypothetical protein